MRIGIIVLAGVALGVMGCQQTTADSGPAGPGTIELCNSQGCGTAPADIATFDPSSAVEPTDPNGILPVLVAEAEADPRAAFDLGMRYMRGDGIRRDPFQALRWMHDAAEMGDLRAQSALGRIYLTGLEEMGADYNEAHKWLTVAASRGDREASELARAAQDKRAEEQAFQDALRRWREVYTKTYWYGSRYYGYYDYGDWGYYNGRYSRRHVYRYY
ncbi:MAG: tetratricopeptide repeat protein [Pseudomonadota bacterium]